MQLITPAEAATRVTSALKGAAEATGAGFDYLLRTARRESSLNPTAQAPTSSARGLFQFIDQTWLEVLKEEGPKLGLADAAADVTKTASGKYTVADPQRRAELLALRDDPQASALLAGAFTRRNADAFQSSVGRAPTEGELYVAHFMGAKGAADLVGLASKSPEAAAADAFPAQAAANRAIFFDKGRARSALEVYGRLTALGAAKGAPSSEPVTPSIRVASAMQAVKADLSEQAQPAYNGGVEDDRTAFHSMFKTGRRSPVSAYVAQAWSGYGAAGMAADVTIADAAHRIALTDRPAQASASTVARAYAADPAPAARTRASSAAIEAVNAAAAGASPKRKSVPTPPVAPSSAAHQAAPTAIPAAAPASFDLVSFLRNAFQAPASGSTPRSGRP